MRIFNYQNLFFLLIISYFINSCIPEKDIENIKVVNSFPKEKHIETKDVKWIKPYKPIGLMQIDSFLIVLNYEGKYVYQVYNTNKKTLVKECGKFGRGPNEVILPRFATQYLKNDNGRFFYVYSSPRKLIYTIDLDKLLAGNDYVVEKNKLSKKLGMQTHIIKVDSLVIGSNYGINGKIFTYNLYNKKLKLWDYYPEIPNMKSFNEYELYVLYARIWTYNKERNLLAGAFGTYFNQLVFYTTEGKRLKTIKLPTTDYKLNSKQFLEKDPGPSYATNITTAYNNIYVSYAADAYKDKVKYKLGSVINIFDWDGEPKMQYFIKEKLIWMSVVDEINNKVYAYAPDNEDNLIVEFDL